MIGHPRVEALVAAFGRADATMRELPIYNSALSVEAWGFRELGETEITGVLITPWFMNLVVLPVDPRPLHAARYGEARKVQFPAGIKRLRYAGDPDLGEIWAASLHSPMDVFQTQEQARAEARLRLAEAMTPPAAVAEATACPSRRAFFGAASRAAD